VFLGKGFNRQLLYGIEIRRCLVLAEPPRISLFDAATLQHIADKGAMKPVFQFLHEHHNFQPLIDLESNFVCCSDIMSSI
jgi:hypothetical protein